MTTLSHYNFSENASWQRQDIIAVYEIQVLSRFLVQKQRLKIRFFTKLIPYP